MTTPNHKLGCNTCAERSYVSKTPVPRAIHAPPQVGPDSVCHGCVERAAILSEIGTLRETVIALSSGMLEVNNIVAEQKRRIISLEAQISAATVRGAQSNVNNAAANVLSQSNLNISGSGITPINSPSKFSSNSPSRNQQQHVFVQDPSTYGSHQNHNLIGLSSIVDKMIQNSATSIESKILATVRASEKQRNEGEYKALRDEIQRRTNELEREFERKFQKLDSQWNIADRQIKEHISSNDRKTSRTIFQLCQTLGVAVPPAASSSSQNTNTYSNTSMGSSTNPVPSALATPNFGPTSTSAYSHNNNQNNSNSNTNVSGGGGSSVLRRLSNSGNNPTNEVGSALTSPNTSSVNDGYNNNNNAY